MSRQNNLSQMELFPTLSPEDSRARIFPSRGVVQASLENDLDYGQSYVELLATYDHHSRSWRTSQLCLLEGWAELSETWPRSGMTVNGTAYQLQPLVHLTDGIASGLLPTLLGQGGWSIRSGPTNHRAAWRCLMLPTPGANEYKGSSRLRYRNSTHFRGAKTSEGLRTCVDDPIYLNPLFGELMMGYAKDYTDLETPSSPKSQK